MRRETCLAALLGALALAGACDGGAVCPAGSTGGGAPLGARCASDCDCSAANCYQGHCLPRVEWTASLLSTNANVQSLAAVPDALFLGGSFEGPLDVDPTSGEHLIVAQTMMRPFAAALAPDESLLWGDLLTTPAPDPMAPNPQEAVVAHAFGQTVFFGSGAARSSVDTLWRLDRVTGQLQQSVTHMEALDFDVRSDTGELIAVDGSYVWAIDQTGVETWRTYERGDRVIASPDGSVVVGADLDGTIDLDPGPGYQPYTPLHNDVQVLKLDRSGTLLWRTILAGDGWHWFDNIAAAADGTVYVLGHFDGILDAGGGFTSGGQSDIFVAALDAAGAIKWVTATGSPNADQADSIVALPDGGVLITGSGQIAFPDAPLPDPTVLGFIFQLDASGGYVWSLYNDKLPGHLEIGDDGALYVFGQLSGVLDATPFRGGKIASVQAATVVYYPSGVVLKMLMR